MGRHWTILYGNSDYLTPNLTLDAFIEVRRNCSEHFIELESLLITADGLFSSLVILNSGYTNSGLSDFKLWLKSIDNNGL